MSIASWTRTTLLATAALLLAPLSTTQIHAQTSAQAPAPSTAIAGNWQGTLTAGSAQLRLVLHIVQAPGGALTATLDSVDQGALGIPVTAIALKGNHLHLTIASVHGSYDGTLANSGDAIHGTWTQGQPLPLDFTRIEHPVAAAQPAPSALNGIWSGSLNVGAVSLRLVFHIANTTAGLTATMDSPDQGLKGLPMTSVARSGDSLRIASGQLGGVFAGTIASDTRTITGNWTQHGHNFPLVLTRVKTEAALELPRPQTPKPPFPYRSLDVSYINPAAHDTLAATLTIPQGKGPFPAVLLIAGSGPQDRDETILGHKPFLVLADYLARHDIEVLRADKRGIGRSTGDYATATTADLASDAKAGVAFLKTCPEVDPHRIGLIGHSEGAVIAPMIAARDPDVDFIVMMAGTGVPGAQVIAQQALLIAEANGVPAATAEKHAATERELLAMVVNEKDPAVLDQELRAKLAGHVPPAQIDSQIKALTSPWLRYFLNYDPATALRHVHCPVLVLNGSKDLQVSPAQNLPAIRAALVAGGNKHFEIDELPGLNHLFQPAKTGSPSEYAQIPETIAPLALRTISTWILRQQ